MDKLKAAELIHRHRRQWRWEGADEVIARRAEQIFFYGVIAEAFLGGLFFGLVIGLKQGAFFIPVAICFADAPFLNGYRLKFKRVVQVLAEPDAKLV